MYNRQNKKLRASFSSEAKNPTRQTKQKLRASFLSEAKNLARQSKQKLMYYVYILTNFTNKVLYTGVTNNLTRRIYEHKSEINKGFSQKYKTHKLVYYEVYNHSQEAIAREKQIKGFLKIKKISTRVVDISAHHLATFYSITVPSPLSELVSV